MDLVLLLLRVAIGAPLFLYLPGYLVARAWLDSSNRLAGIERRVSHVVASMLITGPLALLLAEFNIFSLWLLAGILVIFCALLFLGARRRMTHNPPVSHDRPALGIVAGQPTTAHRTLESLRVRLLSLRFDHVLLLMIIVFAALVARPFEVIRGGLDAGVYANTGIAIARTGAIVQHDPIVAEIGRRAAAGDVDARQFESNVLGTQNPVRFLATRLRAAGFFINAGELPEGRVVPQFFHLWPAWIAVFVAMLGPTAGLVATGAAGTLGVALLGLIGRRFGGPLVGILGAAFLALMTPQVWFSRMSTSEALAQVLILAGLWAYTHFADSQEHRARIWWGAITGAAFGQLALTRIDFALAVAPVVGLLLYVAITRRWHSGYTALALALGGFLAHAALHALLVSRAYLIDTTLPTLQKYALTIYAAWPFLSPELQEYTRVRPGSHIGDWPRLALELGLVTLLLTVIVALWRWPRPVLALERLIRRWRFALLNLAVIALGLAATYAYLIRPEILNAEVLSQPLRHDNWLRLQGYVGAPIEIPIDKYCVNINGELKTRGDTEKHCKETEYIALANMVRFGWYLSPLGVALGTAGLLLLWRRLDRRSWLFALIATAYLIFFINSLFGTRDQTYIYILRRYVLLAYPAYALGMALALAALAGSAVSRWRGPRMAIASALAAALLLFFVVTGRTVYAHVEYAGALDQIESIADRIGPDDIVLVRGGGPSMVEVRDTSELIAAPLTYIYGRNAFPVKGTTPAKYADAFAAQVDRWRAEGRRVLLLLSASGGDLLFPGYESRPVATHTLKLTEFQQLRDQKPKLSYVNEVPWTLYELAPSSDGAPPTAITYDDTAAQVAGFYRSEQPTPDQPRAAWTNGAGVLRLPAAWQGRRLSLELAGGVRPASIGAARVCVDVTVEQVPHTDAGLAALPWREITCADLPEQTTHVSLDLPDLGADESLLIRLRSETWIPARVSASPDGRALGVRFVGANVASR